MRLPKASGTKPQGFICRVCSILYCKYYDSIWTMAECKTRECLHDILQREVLTKCHSKELEGEWLQEDYKSWTASCLGIQQEAYQLAV